MTKIVTQSAIVGALAFSALGVGAGVANADQLVPSSPGMMWKLDRDDDWDDWGGDWNRGDWNRGDWNNGDWNNGNWNNGWGGGPGWNGPPASPCGAGVWVPPAVWQWVPPAAWGC